MTTHIQGIPPIPPEEMTATVRLLLAFIAQQQQTIEQLQQQVHFTRSQMQSCSARGLRQ